MRVCVCTVVHHPEDARILHRQIGALLAAGHRVTYIAPFRARNVTPWRELRPVDVPQADGRHRLRAVRAARRALAEHGPHADVILLPDPALVAALPRAVRRRTVVWDVREDAETAVPWAGRTLAARAERRHRLLLADERLGARFRGEHPVVPDTTAVPDVAPGPPDGRRIVHVGRLSTAGGALDLIELARRMRPEGVAVELIGAADLAVRPALREAQREGLLRWYGFVPNDRALRIAEGALAGLALPREAPERDVPTRVVEYMARGVPVVTTPDPAAAGLVQDAGCGLVVPYGDPAAAAAAVRRLRADPALRAGMGRRGHATARARFHWPDDGERFVALLEKWAGARPREVERVTAARRRPDVPPPRGPAGEPPRAGSTR